MNIQDFVRTFHLDLKYYFCATFFLKSHHYNAERFGTKQIRSCIHVWPKRV